MPAFCRFYPYTLLLFAVCCSLSVPLEASETDSSASAWLEKMVRAAHTLNYTGTFVYRNGQQIESMRVIHRANGDGERERMVSLSGVPREVIRDRSRVTCILGDNQSVVVGRSRPQSVIFAEAFAAGDTPNRHYAVFVAGQDRVVERATTVIVIRPKDRYRYGFRLGVDRETGLLLKSELIGQAGRALEQFIYTSLEFPSHIPDGMLEPSISGAGFKWYTNETKPSKTGRAARPGWEVGWLPDGFVETDRSKHKMASGRLPVEHRVFTDGLASLSVYIESMESDGDRLEGLSNMGALNAFGKLVDNFQVTVVGEVPPITVRRVGASITRTSP